MTSETTRRGWRLALPLALAILTAAVCAAAATAAPPTNTASPTIEGPGDIPFVGDQLTASKGSWTGSPTSYTYQWDRCNALGDRVGCTPIAGATSQTYTVQKADVGHTLRARVTAKNADGSATKDSQGTGIVSDTVAPKNYARPTVTGSATVGSTLTATTGTWAGATSYSFQWQQCSSGGNNCTDISGASGRTYGVRSTDVGHELRVEVTATNKYGSTKAFSTFTDVVGGTPTTTQQTTTVVTVITPPPVNKPPKIQFLSLIVRGHGVDVRFRVCQSGTGKVTVTERDQLTKKAGYTRRYAIRPLKCGTYARHFTLIPRFRGHGTYTVTLRALDSSRRLSTTARRSLRR